MGNNNFHDTDFSNLKVAIIHEWFVDYSGSERLVEQYLKIFPQADLYALVDFLPENMRGFINNKPVTTSFIQKLPFAKSKYRSYLPLMPLAVEQFDLSGYDLIISNNHAVSKGVITGADQLHVCICCSPIRYAWDLTHQYLKESGLTKGIKSWLARYILHRIRMWDHRTSNGVDEFAAISEYIGRRIKKVYGRESTVIYPPVDIERFSFQEIKEDYYFTVSRMVPYKKIDLIVRAFSEMPDKKLIVVGDGPEFEKVKSAAGPNVELWGFQPTDQIVEYMRKARAFVFAAEEDFGIVPVEAQACGTPVIAYGRGGATETVTSGISGIFFDEQTVESLREAVMRFERHRDKFDPSLVRANSMQFSIENFRNNFSDFMAGTIEKFRGARMRPNGRTITFKSKYEEIEKPDKTPLNTPIET